MKKLVSSLLLLGSTAVIFAQSPSLQTAGTSSQIPASKGQSSEPRVACANDELDYAIAKNIGTTVRLIGLQANQTTAIAAGSQYFPAGQPITVSGLWVLGRKPTAGNITVKGSIYAATADSLPGAELGSGTVTITTTAAAIGYVEINFATPVTTSGAYIVAVENMTASPAFQICTNYFTPAGDTASGRSEFLSRAKYGGNWLNPGSLFTGFNADFIISPKVSYSNTANFTLSATTACLNNAVTLTNTSSPTYSSRFYNINAFLHHFGNVPDSTFRWTLPSGSTYSTNASINSSVVGAANARLTATLVPWQNVANCVDSITKTVTYTVDNAAFSFTSNTFCSGSANPVPTTSTPGTFSGSAGLNFVSTTTGEIDLTTTVDGSYTVTYTTSGPCPATSSQTINITSAPDASFTYANTAYCLGSGNPTPVFGAGAGAGTFSSTTGLNFVSAGTGEINLATSVAGTYTVTNTIAASGSCPASSETFDITLNAKPTASISGGGIICAGSGTTVDVTATLTGAGPWSIVVNNGTTNLPAVPVTTSPYTISVNEIAAGTYTIATVTDANCSNTGQGSATITVNPVPTVNAVANQTLCAGATSTAVAFGSPVAGTTYAWTNNTASIGLAASGNGNIATFTAANAGTTPVVATVTVTPTSNGCVGTPSTFTITVNPAPEVTFSTLPAMMCVYNNNITLGGATPAGGTYSGTGVTGTTFNAATAGVGTHTVTYTVTVAGCSGTATDQIEVSACAGIEDLIAAGVLNIFPNPASEQVTFTFNDAQADNVALTIISQEGKTVYQTNFQTMGSGYTKTVDVSKFAKGIYYVRINSNGNTTTAKLVLN